MREFLSARSVVVPMNRFVLPTVLENDVKCAYSPIASAILAHATIRTHRDNKVIRGVAITRVLARRQRRRGRSIRQRESDSCTSRRRDSQPKEKSYVDDLHAAETRLPLLCP